MRSIVRIKFGSHLYGTSTPASDLDFKSVYIPDARSILLQRVKGSISTKREKAEGEKNYAGEIDEEAFSLQRYLGLLAEGQTVATDVLFAPVSSMEIPPTDEWQEVVANRHRLITSKSASFVGYCRQQANKYGIKGSRVAAARKALGVLQHALEEEGPTAKLAAIGETIRKTAAETEHMEIIAVEQGSDARPIDHWDICGRKLSFLASIKNGHAIIARLVAEYGHRALKAEAQDGVDWKALSHAVRVARQAVELLSTGRITFPLASAPHLLEIKTGKIAYQRVAEEIERGLIEVEEASARSTLPPQPDYEWIDDFVSRVYRREVHR